MATGRTVQVNVSLSEAPAFRRLVQFLEDVESHGRIHADEEVQGLVDECRSDLLHAPNAEDEVDA